MSHTRPSSDFFRVCVSLLTAALLAAVALVVAYLSTGVGYATSSHLLVTAYLVAWPTYAVLYVGWSTLSFARLSPEALTRVAADDDRDERRILPRLLGVTGATNTTISAAVLAVIITISIAQNPDFRSQTIYVVLALLMVASSWVLMVFSFAQSYLRLGVADGARSAISFHFPETPRFADYVTLAVLLSTMAATVSAEITSRQAWRVVRTNVLIAFTFNSVIIAMMVSLLFGGLIS